MWHGLMMRVRAFLLGNVEATSLPEVFASNSTPSPPPPAHAAAPASCTWTTPPTVWTARSPRAEGACGPKVSSAAREGLRSYRLPAAHEHARSVQGTRAGAHLIARTVMERIASYQSWLASAESGACSLP